MLTPRQCKATRKDGTPCQGWAVEGSEFCFWHDPASAGKRAAARKKGGLARRKPGPTLAEKHRDLAFRTLGDIEVLLEMAIQEALRLGNSISRSRCLGYLAGQWARVHEVGSMEERLAALERIVAERRGDE